jgi:hypothetical protein
MRIRISFALAAAAAVAACARSGPPAATPAPVITIHAHDYAYTAPDTVPAGMVTIHLINDGPDLHHANIVRLDSGKTAADLDAALAGKGPLPAWAVLLGGPNAPAPGDSATAIMALTPGHYEILCFVDMPGGIPHFARGMRHPFVVTASTANATPPVTDVSLTLVDYGFEFSKPLTRGPHVVAVRDSSSQPHEIEIVKLAPGKTGEDFLKWMADPKGPPPGTPMGGSAMQAPGTTDYIRVDLQPGTYLYICFVPDARDGKPHFMHGMMHTQVIE